MAKKRVGKLPKAFRQRAGDRLNHCEHIVEWPRNSASVDGCCYGWREKLELLDRSGTTSDYARGHVPESGGGLRIERMSVSPDEPSGVLPVAARELLESSYASVFK